MERAIEQPNIQNQITEKKILNIKSSVINKLYKCITRKKKLCQPART